jgi:hypothetical protein
MVPLTFHLGNSWKGLICFTPRPRQPPLDVLDEKKSLVLFRNQTTSSRSSSLVAISTVQSNKQPPFPLTDGIQTAELRVLSQITILLSNLSQLLHKEGMRRNTLHSAHFRILGFPATGLDRSLGFQQVEAPRISRQSAHDGGKVVSPMHRLSLPPGKIPGTHFS